MITERNLQNPPHWCAACFSPIKNNFHFCNDICVWHLSDVAEYVKIQRNSGTKPMHSVVNKPQVGIKVSSQAKNWLRSALRQHSLKQRFYKFPVNGSMTFHDLSFGKICWSAKLQNGNVCWNALQNGWHSLFWKKKVKQKKFNWFGKILCFIRLFSCINNSQQANN